MKKGFTLVELLAVIVILAIISLIAVPIVINIIDSSKKETSDISVELYGRAVENAKYLYEVNNGVIPVGSFKLSSNGKLISEDDKITLEVEYDGNVECDTIEIYENGDVYISDCNVNNESIEYVYGEAPIYENGKIIYFNVKDGISCTKEEYESSWDETANDYLNSKTGYNGIKEESDTTSANSCLKFYVFNDNLKSNKVNLILDHNTTATIDWTNSETSMIMDGPINVISQLKNDTKDWKGTITPKNYSIEKTVPFNAPSNITTYKISYIVNYSEYKARLIEAKEIAQIIGDTTFNEIESTSIIEIDSQNAWLYDRTSTSCTTYGCLNNADSLMTGTGYWTISPWSQTNPYYVIYQGKVGNSTPYNYFPNNNSVLGVRPIIEVLKNKLD